jgi:RNA polymerase sigma factor (TIGR02999 family)
MTSDLPRTVTRLLDAVRQGDASAKDRLERLLYDELHGLAVAALRRERAGHTFQPTDLVHEAFLRLLDADALARAPNRAYLFGAASAALRRVLVDHARARAAARRGGGLRRTSLDDALDFYESKRIDITELHDALEALQALHPRQRQVVDEYHFGGFTLREIAEHLGVSEATVCTDFQRARLWLADRMGKER